jgi:hypothetical protein
VARAWNLLHQRQIDLRPSVISSENGSFYPSRTKDTWGLFPWKGMPGREKFNLFLLGVTDTVQAVPVTCDRLSLDPDGSLVNIVTHPNLNLFLVVARDENDQSTFLYLGRVRKDSTGKLYQAETYRVGSFDEVLWPIFSRDGQVLLFAMRDGRQTNLVFSHLVDLVAEVNRRYPEAKFDLEELK